MVITGIDLGVIIVTHPIITHRFIMPRLISGIITPVTVVIGADITPVITIAGRFTVHRALQTVPARA